jgi:glycosyltransferase involved in cell wall biosynthesis
LAAKIVSVSEGVEKKICKAASPDKLKYFHVIKNGIDFETFTTHIQNHSVDRKTAGFPEDAFIIGSVGRFVPVKNFFFLLDLIADLSARRDNVYAAIIGAGPLEHKLREYAHSLNIDHKVRFFIDQPSYRYYSIMDCYIQPSRHEGFGLAVLEAMYMRLPCIVSSPDGDHPFVQDGVTGLVVQGYRKDDYVHCLELVADHENLRKQLGDHAHASVTHGYSSRIMVDSYEKLYRDALVQFDTNRNKAE